MKLRKITPGASKLDKLRGILNTGFTGFFLSQAPDIMQGFIAEFLKDVSPQQVISYVSQDKSIWDMVPEKDKETIRTQAQRLGDMEWLTPEWFIEALREDLPELASLFLSWDDAYKWLERQIESFKAMG